MKTDFSILKSLGMEDKKETKISTLSKGMKRKIEISRALINNPEILIFDEPNSGLDPITSKFIRDFMKKLSREGKTVLMATHYLYEAENVCDRVGILSDGKLIETGTIENLRNKFKEHDLEDISIKAITGQKHFFFLISSISNLQKIFQRGFRILRQLPFPTYTMITALALNLIAISAAVIGCALATAEDLKTKLIPNKIPFA